jgi:FSR family fosmidomycin resistance protein-like MFS transporter
MSNDARPRGDATKAGSRGLWGVLIGLALCHALSDFYATALTPLVETFRQKFGLTEAGIAMVGAVVGVFGSMVQPLFGLWSDRARRGGLAAVGLAVSAVFMGLIGLSPNVVVLAALLTVGALGVAAFHPSSAVLATAPMPKRSLAMGVFLAGGGLGLTLSPLVVPLVADHLGLRGLWVIAFPGVLLALWVRTATRDEPRATGPHKRLRLRALFSAGTRPIWALFGSAILRSLVITAFIFFITVLGAQRGWDRVVSGRVLALFLAASFVGGLAGGWLGQWRDPRGILAASSLGTAPLLYWFAASSDWTAIAAFGAAGFVFGMGNPLNTSLAQELRPESASAVSGLMMGLAWGIANLLLIAVGAAGRAAGIESALQVVAWLGAAAALFVLFIPSPRPAEP